MENQNKPVLLEVVDIKTDYPYFFKNSNIDDNIYIAQKATSEANALYIIYVWNTERFNPAPISRELKNISFSGYFYNNNDDITKTGHDDDYKIIYYKHENKINYIALLKL